MSIVTSAVRPRSSHSKKPSSRERSVIRSRTGRSNAVSAWFVKSRSSKTADSEMTCDGGKRVTPTRRSKR